MRLATLVFALVVLAQSVAAQTAGQTVGQTAGQTGGQTGGEGGDAAKREALDAYGRSTPRGTVQGYLDAVADDDYARARRYLDLSGLTPFQARGLAFSLKTVLDRSGTLLPTTEIANVPEGRAGDNLPLDIDRVGALGPGRSVDLLLSRSRTDDGAIWRFAPQTLARVPGLVRNSRAGLVERLTPAPLRDVAWRGVRPGDLLAVVLLAFTSWLAGRFVARMIAFAFRVMWSRAGTGRFGLWTVSARKAFGLLLATFWFKGGALALGVSVVVREFTGRIADIVTVLAIAWLAATMIDHLARALIERSMRSSLKSSVSVLKLVRRLAKTVVVVLAALVILDIFNLDVTTSLAALGIGGLALALGAQKTIENLVGSVTLVADQPIRVGDFCQFGGVLGTVEDIGLRSTRIRTLDRTVVTIPNGAFASMQIENFTRRDSFLFQHTFGLRYETGAAQTRHAIDAVTSLLHRHEAVREETVRVRLVRLGNDALSIEAFAYVTARDWDDYLTVQQQLLLGVMDTFEAIGTDFAFPSQTVYLGRDARRTARSRRSRHRFEIGERPDQCLSHRSRSTGLTLPSRLVPEMGAWTRGSKSNCALGAAPWRGSGAWL